ncbi:hypothetical protein BDV59DRAFT_197806 [Aspergillus ambiguus]|uniref:LysM peptidoglycan-binding domain-containing protein n=1 Tax=Aspergillus ambiguus TaxID=176160 RepID=UPI003CCDD242
MVFKSTFCWALLASSLSTAAATCNPQTLNTTTYLYPITKENTTVFDVAKATNRGVCDIGRHNLMADVTIIPNVGEEFIIPPETCEPDNETCLLPEVDSTRTCINGGPRLYYTVNGDTYEKIARRLNISTASLMDWDMSGAAATDILPVGQFLKVPLCEPSQCVIKPYSFKWGVYKDLAEKFGTTVGQIMMLSASYNYSSVAFSAGGTYPPINILVNCTTLSNNVTVLN